MIKVSTTAMAVSLKADLRFPNPGQQGHGRRIIQFGRLKNEMFYNRDWTGVSIQEFIDILDEYLVWYNEKRIKTSLGNMSPREYRQSLGLAA